MADIKHVTPSGVTITDSDLKTIQKATTRENLKTGLAVIGAGAVLIFARGIMQNNGQIVLFPEKTD